MSMLTPNPEWMNYKKKFNKEKNTKTNKPFMFYAESTLVSFFFQLSYEGKLFSFSNTLFSCHHVFMLQCNFSLDPQEFDLTDICLWK